MMKNDLVIGCSKGEEEYYVDTWDEPIKKTRKTLILCVEFKDYNFLYELSDDEIEDLIFQDHSIYTIEDRLYIKINRDNGLEICAVIDDKDEWYYNHEDEAIQLLKEFKQWKLNGITLYMMTKVVL